MTYTVSALRADLYRLIDRVLETGLPLEIERKGRRLRIVPVQETGRLARLQRHPNYIDGDPEDLVHLDWSDEWKP